MSRGFSVLKNPHMYSKKRVEQALKRAEKKRKKVSTIEQAMARHEQQDRPKPEPVLSFDMDKPNGAAIKAHCRSTLHFDAIDNTYRINGLKIDMLDPENAAEVVRRFNSGDA